jgi:hypothetical protein
MMMMTIMMIMMIMLMMIIIILCLFPLFQFSYLHRFLPGFGPHLPMEWYWEKAGRSLKLTTHNRIMVKNAWSHTSTRFLVEIMKYTFTKDFSYSFIYHTEMFRSLL